MKKLRINYTISAPGYTGGTKTFVEITKRLVERGHNVSVTCRPFLPFLPKPPWKVNFIHTSLIKTIANRLFFKMLLKNKPRFLSMRQEMLRKKIPECDISVATDVFSALPVSLQNTGITIHHQQHDETLFYQDKNLQAIARESYYLPFNARISNSSWLQARLKDKYKIGSFLINHAIANEIFYPRDVGKNKTKKRIVSFGRILPLKGFKDALAAMTLVFRKRKDIEWIVYGQNTNLPKSPDAPYQFIHFPSDDELAELYSSADVVFCPSWYESFPAPPLEAMSCGAPVVTTAYGTEDYAIQGQTALVVPPRNPQALAEAILEILDDQHLSNTLKENGPQMAQNFSWDTTTDKVEKLFIDLYETTRV